jgi:hypothetical protein
MPAPDWLARPRHRLPRTVTPFHNETVHSFLWRLASANHISILELRPYLAGSPKDIPRPDWVAIASGWPLPVLARRIRGLAGEMQPGQHSGTACRRCMARRGVFERVVICRPMHVNVCLRHQLWIGDTHSPEDHLDISAIPELLSAQRSHQGMVRQHGAEVTDSAYNDARHIVRRWTERYDWPEHRDRRLKTAFAHRYQRLLMNSIEIDVANYPEVVALTAILASEHWRRKAAPDAADLHSRAEQQFYAEVARRLKIGYRPRSYDPLVAWVNDERRSQLLQHTARSRTDRTI